MTAQTIAECQKGYRELVHNPGTSREAGCSVWWGRNWRCPDRRPGLIGRLRAPEGGAAIALLDEAAQVLIELGCDSLYGPVEGSIWHDYRAVLGPDQEAGSCPFPMLPFEPKTGPLWAEWLQRAGFALWAGYRSDIAPLPLVRRRPRRRASNEGSGPMSSAAETAPDNGHRLLRGGVLLRCLDLDHWHRDLRAIHQLSCRCFTDSLLFEPLPWADFQDLYAPYRDRLDPDFCLVAEREGEMAGFLFAFPVIGWPDTDSNPKLVMKTHVVAPEYRGLGLGPRLIDVVCERAHQRGMTAVIGALLRDGRSSQTFSRSLGATTFRRYGLFRRSLGAGAEG